MRFSLTYSFVTCFASASQSAPPPLTKEVNEALKRQADGTGEVTTYVIQQMDRLKSSSFIEFFRTQEGAELGKKLVEKNGGSKFWPCLVNLEGCFGSRQDILKFLDDGNWFDAEWKLGRDPDNIKSGIDLILRRAENDVDVAEEKVEYGAEQLWGSIVSESEKKCGAGNDENCKKLKELTEGNWFCRAAAMRRLPITNFVGAPESDEEVIRMTFDGLKGIKMVELHHEIREYFTSTERPTALEFLQRKAIVRVENFLFWQVELVRQSLQSVTDEKLSELAKRLGEPALKSFLQSETGKRTIPLRSIEIISCYVDWHNCSDLDPTVVFEANGIVGSFNKAGYKAAVLKESLYKLLVAGKDDPHRALDERQEGYVMENLFNPIINNPPIAKAKVLRNFYTMAIAIRKRNEIGMDAFEDIFDVPELHKDVSKMAVLQQLSKMNLGELHNELQEMFPRYRDLNNILGKLSEPTEFGNAPLFTVRSLRRLLSGPSGGYFATIMVLIDRFTFDVCASFFHSDEGKALVSQFLGKKNIVQQDCLYDLSECFTANSRAYLIEAGWYNSFY